MNAYEKIIQGLGKTHPKVLEGTVPGSHTGPEIVFILNSQGGNFIIPQGVI